jgi:GNAT superfamily N-acetyltransferase
LVREADQVVAGGTGRTEFSRLFVNYLWVTEPLRSRGLGQQVSAMLESAARERGCVDALIETLDDHVASLYVRWGYTAVATIPTYVGRFTKHVLVKPLPSVERCS